ncbi:MAG: hypothetical protein ACE149_06980 [Armatimonadota bacterium]
MVRAHLVGLLRRHLLEAGTVPPNGLARMTDEDVVTSCFACPALEVSSPSADELDQLVASCETLEAFLALADVWRELNAMTRPSQMIEPNREPWNMAYDPGPNYEIRPWSQ